MADLPADGAVIREDVHTGGYRRALLLDIIVKREMLLVFLADIVWWRSDN
jgi:hypothetical protein